MEIRKREFAIIALVLCISPLGTYFQGNASGKTTAPSCDTVHFKITRNIELPYRGGIDIETVVYDSTLFRGPDSDYGEIVRYIPLLRKGDIGLVLTGPVYEGDYPYTFHLSVIKDDKVVSELYVEGEWHLEERYNKEHTNFVLFESDDDLYVTVTTTWDFHDREGSSGIKTYQILDTGEIVETEKKFHGYTNTGTTAPLIDTVHFKITRNIELPYRGGIDMETAVYDTALFNGQGIDHGKKIRYIPLLRRGNISLVLGHIDAAEFPYMFYLWPVKNGKIVFDLYVEGEWYEKPDNKEHTSFVLFESEGDLYVTVKTIWDKHDIWGSSGVKTYRILDTGEIVETDTVKQP